MQKLRVGRAFRLTMNGLVEPTTQEQHLQLRCKQRGAVDRRAQNSAERRLERRRASPRGARSTRGSRGQENFCWRLVSPARDDGRRRSRCRDSGGTCRGSELLAGDAHVGDQGFRSDHGLYHLPTRREGRPAIGGRAAALASSLSSMASGRCPTTACVEPERGYLYMQSAALRAFRATTPPMTRVSPRRRHPSTSMAQPILQPHLSLPAAEPRETIVAVAEDDVEVAYETTVLGILRPGYRAPDAQPARHTRTLCAVCPHSHRQEANVVGEARSCAGWSACRRPSLLTRSGSSRSS